MLHITNGESAAIGLRRSGIPGVFLAWNDILHEGPVPAGLALDQLSELRARFIAGRGWSSYEDTLEGFRSRNSILEHFRDEQDVVLWFEHDLYDQLQLLQILDWFAGHELGDTSLTLISIDSFPGFAAFHGLGELSPAQLHALFPDRQPVTASTLALARAAWDAFRSPDPRAIENILARDTSAMPYLASAFQRHLQQFPAVVTGLSRSERQLLEALANGPNHPVPLFVAAQAMEEAPFLGDWPFWQYAHELSQGSAPLLVRQDGMPFQLPEFSNTSASQAAFLEQELILTARGNAVFAGQADWLQIHPIDRWLGGVHLTGHEPAWRWDEGHGRVVAVTP
ncbi:MAG TPA: hypothetical protein VGF38_06950 [Ktedonobacterales bacterium]